MLPHCGSQLCAAFFVCCKASFWYFDHLFSMLIGSSLCLAMCEWGVFFSASKKHDLEVTDRFLKAMLRLKIG